MKAIADMGLSTPPKTKTELCETHGEFESRCYLGSVWTKCPACSAEAVAKEREAEEAKARAERVAAWQRKIGDAGIPEAAFLPKPFTLNELTQRVKDQLEA